MTTRDRNRCGQTCTRLNLTFDGEFPHLGLPAAMIAEFTRNTVPLCVHKQTVCFRIQ